MAAPRITDLTFADLDGWARDDHALALSAFLTTCNSVPGHDWPRLAHAAPDPRRFFEMHFRPVLIEDGTPMLFTGYFEPTLFASRVQTPRFAHPIYSVPADQPAGVPGPTRAEIDDGALAGLGLELAWLETPVDAFFLQVQGSGRLILPDQSTMRVNFAAKNGRPYTSIGRTLIAHGHLPADAAGADAVRDWLLDHPGPARGLMQANQSFVFFRALPDLADDAGPLGAMGHPVTPMRSVAVDPALVPLGLPVWIETRGTPPLRHLTMAQDTGSAIKGAQRADIYFGSGTAAGMAAGRVRDGGRMVVLMPKGVA